MPKEPTSPLTGIFEEDKVILDFGIHEGKSILEISDTYPDFYQKMIKSKDKKSSNFHIRRGRDKSYFLNMKILDYV